MNCTSCRSLLVALLVLLSSAGMAQQDTVGGLPSVVSTSPMNTTTQLPDTAALAAILAALEALPVKKYDYNQPPSYESECGLRIRANEPSSYAPMKYARLVLALEEAMSIARQLAAEEMQSTRP